MKLKTLVLAMSFTLPGLVVAQTVDFKTSVETTLSQNPQRDITAAQMDQARAAYDQAKLSRMPQFTLSVTGSHSNNALNVFGMKLQQRQATFGDFGFAEAPGPGSTSTFDTRPRDLNKPGSHNDLNTRVEMLLPIYNGGKVESFQQQASAMLHAAQQGDQAVKQMLTYFVYEAYEGVHAARAFIQVAEQALLAADAYIQTTQNLVRQGVVVRSELLSAQAHRAEIELMHEQAKNQELLAFDGLRTLMGWSADAPIDVAERVAIELPNLALDEMIRMAMDTNPQLIAMRHQVQASQAEVRLAKSDKMPSLNLMARSDWNDDTIGFSAHSYTIAAVASWKITDFGMTDRAVDQANASVREQEARMRAEEQKVRMGLLQAWREYQNGLKKVTSSQAAVEYASEAQTLITRRYETGVATMTEVLAGQTQLDKARAELVSSQFSVNMQKAQVLLAIGRMQHNQI
ncbi:TolC family protein [Thiomicrospira microaerophila]|uniref:TolC family protein n=1 Tax=Thiomicrospira microaerophila TaxID=406020 RepID=UPI00200C337F|nr:TolC family protein [Thiomicrospira microaerophila]UQB41348.1 TolC family protein [Thiomicrospira microaerophila]